MSGASFLLIVCSLLLIFCVVFCRQRKNSITVINVAYAELVAARIFFIATAVVLISFWHRPSVTFNSVSLRDVVLKIWLTLNPSFKKVCCKWSIVRVDVDIRSASNLSFSVFFFFFFFVFFSTLLAWELKIQFINEVTINIWFFLILNFVTLQARVTKTRFGMGILVLRMPCIRIVLFVWR